MGDAEYIAAFQRIVMPIAYEFNPELVLVSAGFDAAIGDPIGHYNVTPEAYAYFTHWLSTLANGRIMLCLEGGYNVNSVAHAMTMCTKALLGDPLPILQANSKELNASAVETIQKVQDIQAKYWKSLKFNKLLPAIESPSAHKIEDVDAAFASMHLKCPADTNAGSANASEERKAAATAGGGSGSSGSGSSSSAAATTDAQQSAPSTSGTNASSQPTLADYLRDQPGFAVYPLTDCPHLVLLDEKAVPTCECSKFRPSFRFACVKCESQ